MNRIQAKKQLYKLYGIDSCTGLCIAGASWVALLAARGFTTVEIGFAESIFHIASMVFEIPSGVLSDVFGRKKTMILSCLMSAIAAILMIFSRSFVDIAMVMVISALSYNLASGTREAIAYDSLKEAGIEGEYESFASNDMVIYEITSALGTLLAGVVLLLGYRRAYAIDVVVACSALGIATSLRDVKTEVHEIDSIAKRFHMVAHDSVRFLRENRKARWMMVFNSVVGAVSTLMLFFLQAKLPAIGMKTLLLGPALFAMGLGSAIGAKVVTRFSGARYRYLALFAAAGTILECAAIVFGSMVPLLIGGFVGAFCDSFLQVRTDVELNSMVPSNQRATLMSINSFTFSVVMMVLSPIFGLLFA